MNLWLIVSFSLDQLLKAAFIFLLIELRFCFFLLHLTVKFFLLHVKSWVFFDELFHLGLAHAQGLYLSMGGFNFGVKVIHLLLKFLDSGFVGFWVFFFRCGAVLIVYVSFFSLLRCSEASGLGNRLIHHMFFGMENKIYLGYFLTIDYYFKGLFITQK